MSTVAYDPSLQPTPPAAPADAGAVAAVPPQYMAPGLGFSNLQRNPQLPQTPMGAYTDSMYAAQVAQLRADIARQYNDVLQQLGYTNEQGQFIPGQVEIDANRQQSDLARSIQLADEQTTQQAQQQGTLFSGLRGTAQARAEFPFQQAIAQLGVDVPKQLAALYGQAGDLTNQFTLQNNLYLADAAARAAAAIQNLPGPATGGGSSATGNGTDGTQPSGTPSGTTPGIGVGYYDPVNSRYVFNQPPPSIPPMPGPVSSYGVPNPIHTTVNQNQPGTPVGPYIGTRNAPV